MNHQIKLDFFSVKSLFSIGRGVLITVASFLSSCAGYYQFHNEIRRDVLITITDVAKQNSNEIQISFSVENTGSRPRCISSESFIFIQRSADRHMIPENETFAKRLGQPFFATLEDSGSSDANLISTDGFLELSTDEVIEDTISINPEDYSDSAKYYQKEFGESEYLLRVGINYGIDCSQEKVRFFSHLNGEEVLLEKDTF